MAQRRLEPSWPPAAAAPAAWDSDSRTSRLVRHAAGTRIEAHRHRRAYAALVLDGAFEEAGNRGRRRLGGGHVVVHAPFDGHRDVFARHGATIVNLPLAAGLGRRLAGAWCVPDVDRLARLAARDEREAADALRAVLGIEADVACNDWPDELAATLATMPSTELGSWARARGLSPSALARGFRRAYGISASAFRAQSRARQAVRALVDSAMPLGELAYALGFADQAHMTRAVASLTGSTPARLRRQWP